MRDRVVVALFSSMLAWFAAGGVAGAGEAIKLRHAIVVVVNGKPVTRSEVREAEVFYLKRQYPGQKQIRLTTEEIEKLYRHSLNELIKVRMIRDEAREMRIRADTFEVDKRLERAGVDPLEATPVVREMIEAEYLFDMIQTRSGIPRYRPSPREIRNYWNEYRDTLFVTRRFVKVRHIYRDTTIETEKASLNHKILEKVREIIGRLPRHERTEAFAEQARELSEDAFRAKGGLLLGLSRDPEGYFIQEFRNMRPDGTPLFPESMVRGIRGLVRPGDLSEVIRSEKGYHLLYLEDTRGGERMSWQEAQKVIRYHLERAERNRRLDKWIRDKFENSRITWHDGELYPLDRLLVETPPPGRPAPGSAP